MKLIDTEHRGERPDARQRPLANPAQLVTIYDPGHSGKHIALADERVLSEAGVSVEWLREILDDAAVA